MLDYSDLLILVINCITKILFQRRDCVDGFPALFGCYVLIMPHDGFRSGPYYFGHAFIIRFIFKRGGYKTMTQVIGSDPPGDPRAFKGSFPCCLD